MTLTFGISGYSGSGKTTLIEALLPRLEARGWRVGVVKHDAHRLSLDHEGKDTARFFDAGAAVVCAHDPTQHFLRARSEGVVPLSDILADLPADLDLVLVEGHKHAPIAKLVLAHPQPQPAITGPNVIATLPWGDRRERLLAAEEILERWLERAWRDRPLGVALTLDGRQAPTSRAGLADLAAALRPLSPRLVAVGSGSPAGLPAELPVLLGAPGGSGALALVLGLQRHDPETAWLLVDRRQAGFTPAHAKLLAQARRPGRWAVLPRPAGSQQPELYGAIYEPALRPVLERALARQLDLTGALAGVPVAVAPIPSELCSGWHRG